MKKRIVLWITLAILVSAAAYAQQYDPESDFEVERIDGGRAVEITGYIGSKQEVRIPPRIQGLPVTSIGERAFVECTGLVSITIPNSVTSISMGAFYGCTGLTSITIPNSVTSIGGFAFSGCTSLQRIEVARNNAHFASVDGVLFDKERTELIRFPAARAGSYTIPNSVVSIWIEAFESCTGLTSVTIPNSVTGIGDGAFSGCTGLTSVTIPNSVYFIGGSAFSGCTGLTSITIPNSVTSIGAYAFSGCTNLTSVTFGGSGTGIVASTSDFEFETFPGDLTDKYYAGGAGAYTRAAGSDVWTKR